jgi:HPt (histidine-containing phosphotransfer) domain-containing protein
METMAVFHQDGLEKIGAIMASLESGDLRLFSIHVHALKSACANMGADELSGAAKALELAAERGDSQYVDANAAAFVSSLRLVLERINSALIEYNEGKKGGAGEPDGAALASGLAELKAAIGSMDAAGMNSAVKNLQKLALPEDISAAAARIHDSILMAEYDEALRLIDALSNKGGGVHIG